MNEYEFLNRTSILHGNASEPKTLEEIVENLSAHDNLFKPTIILDAGIATKDYLAWLREKGYSYVVSARQDSPSTDLKGELIAVGDLNNLVKAALIKSGDDSEEKWLYFESDLEVVIAQKIVSIYRLQLPFLGLLQYLCLFCCRGRSCLSYQNELRLVI